MRFNWSRDIFLSWSDMQPLISSANLPAAAMTWSSGVISGLVVCLCLWENVAKICIALVYSIHIIHDR